MKYDMVVSYLKPYRKHLVIGPSFKLTEAVLELAVPLVVAQIIDEGIKSGNIDFIIKKGLLALFLAVTGLICALICQYTASLASQGYGTDLRNKLLSKILYLPAKEIEKAGTTSLVNRITYDTSVLQQAVAMLIRLVVRAPFISIGALVMSLLIDWKLTLVFIIIIPAFILILYFIMSKTVPLYEQSQKEQDKLSDIMHENITGLRIIRAFNRTGLRQKNFSATNKNLSVYIEKAGKMSGWLNPATMLLLNFSIVAILWFGGWQIDNERLSQGQLIALINYLTQILQALIVVANLVLLYARAYASAGRIENILVKKDDINHSNISSAAKLDCSIDFINVHFSYPDSEKKLFEDLNLIINSGETTAFTGPTGSGKTSLIKLLFRQYAVNSGEIKLGGQNINCLEIEKMTAQIGYVPQKSVLLAGTIRENLLLGCNKEEDDERLWWALNLADAAGFIKERPGGLDAEVMQEGRNFSGGQRQRLAIARALIKRPKILIFDDSTSALDYATDRRIRKSISDDPVFAGITWIIISQRVASLKNSDRICLLDEGKIEAFGSHDFLLETSDMYREMFNLQFDGYTTSLDSKELSSSIGGAD